MTSHNLFVSLLLLVASSTTQRKILCLPGGGQSAASMRLMSGMEILVDTLSPLGYEFVFADPPERGNLWLRDVPGGDKSESTTDPEWAATSVAYLTGIVSKEGPFYAILGFSQGGAMIKVFLSQTPPGTFEKVLIFCGYLPSTHLGLMQAINIASPFGRVPAYFFRATNDHYFYSLTAAAARMYHAPIVVTSSTAGHALPNEYDPTFQHAVMFIEDSATFNGGVCSGAGGNPCFPSAYQQMERRLVELFDVLRRNVLHEAIQTMHLFVGEPQRLLENLPWYHAVRGKLKLIRNRCSYFINYMDY